MPSKLIVRGEAAIDKIKKGIDILADTVTGTLGPKGQCVVLENPYSPSPTITKDGVSVAKEISLKDPIENMGAQLVKEVAQRTADTAGDGTTTATLLAQAIFTEGVRAIRAGANPTFVKRGIDAAVDVAVDSIRSASIEVNSDRLRSVARISANNDELLGDLIAVAMQEAGSDGVITVEESKSFETRSEGVTGMELPRGYLSPYFINNEKLTCELENARILITDKTISNHTLITPIMEKCAKQGVPLLVIAGNVEGSALSILAVNMARGQMQSCAIKAPGFSNNQLDILEDVAAVTGGKVISDTLGINLDTVALGDLGTAGHITVSKETCVIIEGAGTEEACQLRIDLAKKSLEQSQSDFDKEKTQERLAKLTGGVIVLHIGAPTETAMKERKARVEDALHATRAAVEEGIVPGGGIAYLDAAAVLWGKTDWPEDVNSKDFEAGVEIVRAALEAPFTKICENAGLNGEVIRSKIAPKNGQGYNLVTDEYGDMIEMGVIDPTKVTINALVNAASVSGILLTLNAVVVNEPEEITDTGRMPAVPGMGPGMMPGM